MSKTVLFFPGQASQYVGMGKELYELSDEVRALYKIASSEMDFDIARLSFEGPAEELKRTRFTQPAILLHSLAVLTVLGDRLPTFDFAAGHSLGEYGALAVTGAMSFEQAIKAVVKRASLMEKACIQRPGTMAAIMGLKADQAEAICNQASAEGVVIPANYNSAIQIAISGEIVGVEKAVELAREAKAKRAMILEVGGAFHSPLMQYAADRMKETLAMIEFGTAKCAIVANVTAEPVESSETIQDLLVKQITAPVKWMQSVEKMYELGVRRFIEIGPGKVLSGLVRKTLTGVEVKNVGTFEEIEQFQRTLETA